jgi:hypothetical protein
MISGRQEPVRSKRKASANHAAAYSGKDLRLWRLGRTPAQGDRQKGEEKLGRM